MSARGLATIGVAAAGCFYQPEGSVTDTHTSTSTSTTTSSAAQPPGVTVLQLKFSPVKRFDFQWSEAEGAEYYQLLERLPGASEHEILEDGITGTTISRTMPLHLRFGASYVVRACNDAGCTDSEPVEVAQSMAAAVGYIKASNPGAGDSFGRVALSGDGRTLAVGAPLEDGDSETAVDSGAVYVFGLTDLGWEMQALLRPAAVDGDGADLFGEHVALSADGNTLAISARGDDSAASGIGGDPLDDMAENCGAAYVFVRDAGAWNQQGYFKPAVAAAGMEFGSSIALARDGATLAIGAYFEDGSGAVHVFARESEGWIAQTRLKGENTEAGDLFGSTVALSADGNTLAIGAVDEDGGTMGVDSVPDEAAERAGAVYVFFRFDGMWKQQAYVKASNPGVADNFGSSVALSASGDALAVGAMGEASAATGVDGDQANDLAANAGAVYVFAREKNAWSQRVYLKPVNVGQKEQLFGVHVAMSADGQLIAVGSRGDDLAGVGVGNPETDRFATDAGAAYVFALAGGAWQQVAYVKASNAAAEQLFGAVALDDSGQTLAVGAIQESGDVAGAQGSADVVHSGAVYLY